MIRCYVCYNIYRWVSLQPDVSHVSDENFAMASGLVTPAAVNAPVGFQHGAKLGLWKWNSIWDHMQYHWFIYIFFVFFGFDCSLWNFYFGDPLNLLICFFRPFVSWLQRSILNQFCFVSVATPLRPLTGHRSDGSSTIGDCKWWALGCFCWDGAMAPHSPQRIDDSGRSTLW